MAAARGSENKHRQRRFRPQDPIASSYVPSILTSLEVAPQRRRPTRGSILTLGIVANGEGQALLEDATAEAELVAEGFTQSTVLLNEEATAEAFAAASSAADVWHFAGHASFPNENEAALIFGGGDTADLQRDSRDVSEPSIAGRSVRLRIRSVRQSDCERTPKPGGRFSGAWRRPCGGNVMAGQTTVPRCSLCPSFTINCESLRRLMP